MKLALLLLCLASPAWGQQNCFPNEEIVTAARDGFGERLRVTGVAYDGNQLQIFFNPVTSTWTLTYKAHNEVTCILARGEFLIFLEDPDVH